MPISKTKMKNAAIAVTSAALPKIPKELLDQFVSGPMTGEAVNAASMAFKKALIERALGAESGVVHTVRGTAANVNVVVEPTRCCTATRRTPSRMRATRVQTSEASRARAIRGICS